MPQLPFRLALIAAALAAIAPARAAEPEIEKVEVKGSAETYNPRRDDTATKIVVNHDEIVKFGDTSVLDVLKRLPGVTVAGNGARGSEIRMRGLGDGYTQILVDGARPAAGFSIETLAPDTIERIEVIRAATAEYSTQAIAGTINIVLRKTVRSAQRELTVRAGVNERSAVTPGLNVKLSDRAGALAYSLWFNVDTYSLRGAFGGVEESFDPQGLPVSRLQHHYVRDNHSRTYSVWPRLSWTLENGDTLVSTSSMSIRNGLVADDYLTTTEFGQAPPFPLQASQVDSSLKQIRSELNWVHRLAGGAKLDTSVSISQANSGADTQRYGYDVLAGPLALDDVYRTAGHNRGYGFSGKYSAPLGSGHAMMAGWETAVSRRNESSRWRQLLPGSGETSVVDDTSSAEVQHLAAFAQDEWNVTPQWSVYAGLRWEGSRQAARGTAFDSSSSHSRLWSPLFQALYKLPGEAGDQLRFALTRTYKEPVSSLLIVSRVVGVNNSRTQPYSSGNPNLKPEIALGFDTSYEHYWTEGAMVSASLSTRTIEGYTDFVVWQDARGLWIRRPENVGRARTGSIELEAKFPLKTLMSNAPEVNLRANVARNWSSVDAIPGPGNRVDNQIPLTATLGADYMNGRMSVGGGMNYRQGGRLRTSVTSVNVTPNFFSADAYALWRFDARNQVRFAVSDLLEKDYRNLELFTDASGLTRSSGVFPAFVSFRLSFEFKY